MTIFEQQANFMEIGGQTVGSMNINQAARYAHHILEEAQELRRAWFEDYDHIKSVDGAVDLIVVAVGFLHSIGVDPQKAWDIVYEANMSKFEDGKPVFRPDGQIGKGKYWKPPEPELAKLVANIP